MAGNQWWANDKPATDAPENFWEKDRRADEKPSGALRRGIADKALGFASGAVGATKALADVAGAGNVVSNTLDAANKGINEYLSPEAKADQQEQAALMDSAKGQGTWEGVKAGAKAFAVAPVQTAVQGLGSIVPILAGTAMTGGAAPAAAVGAGIGAAIGAGTDKGAIYDEIKKRGGTEEEAIKAQEYGGANTDQIALGGALGTADALTGVSKMAGNMVRGALKKPVTELATQTAGKAAERGVLGRAGMGMLSEMPLEAAQGGQEQVAANLAAQRAGYEAGTWDNVASNATLEALASAGPGAAFGAMGTNHNAAPPPGQPPGTVPPAVPPMPPELQNPALQDLQQQEMGAQDVEQTTPPDGRAALNALQERQRLLREEAAAANPSPDDEIYQSTGALNPVRVDPVRVQVEQAAAQGGGLSRAALVHLDQQDREDAKQAQAQAAYDEAEAYKRIFQIQDEDTQPGGAFEALSQLNDSNIPDIFEPTTSNTSEEDFLRWLGASDQEIANAISIASQSSSPQTGASNSIGIAPNVATGTGAGAGPINAKQANLDRIRNASNVSNDSGIRSVPAAGGGQDGNQPTGMRLMGLTPEELATIPADKVRAKPDAEAARTKPTSQPQEQTSEPETSQTIPPVPQQQEAGNQTPAGAATATANTGTAGGRDVQAARVEVSQPAQPAGEGASQPTQEAANQQALDRIAKGDAWFGNELKARNWVQKNGLADTHDVSMAKPGRFEVVAKNGNSAQTTPSSASTGDKKPANKPVQGLGEQLAALNAELERQGAVQNANTRSKRDTIRKQIAEQDFPEILKAVDDNIDVAEDLHRAFQYAGDEPKAKTIERILKNRGITPEYQARWTDRLLGEKQKTESSNTETVKVPQTVSDAFTAQMQKQKGRITRLKNEAEKAGSLEDKRAAQLKVTAAEATLRQMRLKIFDAEDAAVKAVDTGDAKQFSEYADLFPVASEEIAKLTGQNDELDAEMQSYEAKKNPTYSGETKQPLAPADTAPAATGTVAKPDAKAALSEREKAAKAKMFNALGKLAHLAGKNTRMNWTQEEEQQLLPIVIELFDGAMELGAVTFQQAVAYVRDFIAKGIDQETADAIPFDTLQGAYISVAGRHKDKPVTSKKEVVGFESLAELENSADKADTSIKDKPNEPTNTGSENPQALGDMAPEQDGGTESKRRVGRGRKGRSAGSVSDDSGLTEPRVSGTRSGGSGSTSVRAPKPGGTGRGRRTGAGTEGNGSQLPAERGTVPVEDDFFSNKPAAEPVSASNIQATNFRITPDLRLGQGGESEKFRDNLAAIRTLKAIEAEGRRATSEEQRILARYVGWGGLANAFPSPETKEWKDDWKARGAELKDLLTAKEYDLARRSTLDSHYTSQTVVSAMWDAAKRLGFSGGVAAETSMGIGNFIGLMPEGIAGNTRFIGVEYDSLTARMAALLYPQATVLHSGLQKVPLPDSVFDLNIGNPPFGDQSLRFQFKPEFNRVSIHNQFFLAGIDSLKPGGLQLNVVSRYLLDAMDKTTRTMLAKKAKLVAAIRLPDTAFKENARTSVVTDIVMLQRLTPGEQAEMEAAFQAAASKPEKDREKEAERRALAAMVPEWVEVTKMRDPLGGDPMTVNSYFAKNPGMILGTLERSGKMQFKNDITVRPSDRDLGEMLAEVVAKLPEGIANTSQDAVSASLERYTSLSAALKIALSGQEAGSIAFNQDGQMEQVYERETPEGDYELTKRVLTESSPWSESLYQDSKGNWFSIEAKLDEDGNKLKVMKDGKPTKANVYDRKMYASESEIPAGMRLGEKRLARLQKMVKLRDLMVNQINLETEDAPPIRMEGNRQKLAKAYRDFVESDGFISRQANSALVANMPDGALVQALELAYRKEITKKQADKLGESPRPEQADPAPILSERVIPKYEPPTKAASAADALSITMSESGRVDIERIASLLGKSEEEVIAEMFDKADKPLIFKDPETQQWVTRNDYLTGQVKKKLHAAQAAGLEKHVRELEAVQPEPWGAENVTVLLGSTFVPPQVYADFIQHVTGMPAKVSFQQSTNSYAVQANGATQEKQDEWGAEGVSIGSMVSDMLNSTSIKVMTKDADGNTVLDKERTELAQLKARQIASEFTDWAFANGDRRKLLVDLFNEKYNTRVSRQHDGSHLTLPGKVPDAILRMRRHQKNAIWRGISERFMLIDHAVGAGKTFTAIARAMERRRMGLSRKPAIVVPNHMVEQFTADVYRLYPGAKVLAAGGKDFEKKKRRKLFAKIASGDWDIVIIPHSSFGFIGIAPETEERYLEKELALAEQAIKDAWEESEQAESSFRKPFNVKTAERLRDKITARMDSVRGNMNKDRLLTFEQMGIDDLTVDEAHEFKNLFYSTRLKDVKGMGNQSGSQKAFDLYNKVRVLRESPTGAVTFMTGTPISNSAVEMFTMMRYLAADELNELGLEHFDAWRAQFVSADPGWEPNETGRLKEVTRLGRSWSNMRSLMDLYYSFTDSVSNDDIKKAYAEDNNGAKFPIPSVKGGDRRSVVIQPTDDQAQLLTDTMAAFDSLPSIEDPYERNKERLRLMDRARKTSLDVRAAVAGHLGKEKGGKLDKIAEEVKRIYTKFDADKGTQLVFLDRSVPKSKGDDKEIKEYDELIAKRNKALLDDNEAELRRISESLERFDPNEIAELRAAQAGGWNAYQQIKDNLIAQGIPAKEIRFVQEATNDAQKQALFDAVNAGEVRVLIGSTPRMGAGTNVQQRLVGLHHADVTWKPSDIEQREGRIIRQGNKLLDKYGIENFEVEILAYATERTIDSKMWSLNSAKLKTINAIRNYDGSFSMDFDDNDSVSMAEMAALASGNPLLLERVKLDSDINNLEILRKQHQRKTWGYKSRMEDAENDIRNAKPRQALNTTRAAQAKIGADELAADLKTRSVTVEGQTYTNHSDAVKAAEESRKTQQGGDEEAKFSIKIGESRVTSMNGAFDKVYAALGDDSPFLAKVAGKEYRTRTDLAREMANLATEAGPDMVDGETKLLATGQMLGFTFEANMSRGSYRGYEVDFSLVDADGRTVTSTISRPQQDSKIVTSMLSKPLADLDRGISPGYFESEARMAVQRAEKAEKELPDLRTKANMPFAKEAELAEKRARLAKVIAALAGNGKLDEEAKSTNTKQTGDFAGNDTDVVFSRKFSSTAQGQANGTVEQTVADIVKGWATRPSGVTANPTTVAALQAGIRDLVGAFGGNKMGRIVATTASEIKSTWEPLIGSSTNLESEGNAGKAQAFFDPKTNTVFLIADHIEAGNETAVLAHELMHKHGKAVLGEAGWDKLHSVIGTWVNAKEGSQERQVYDQASAAVERVGAELSNEELFPYAVEAAMKMGIKPNGFGKPGTVAKWLAEVRNALKQVWEKIVGKPDTFKAQDLVNLAFGIAQRENDPELTIRNQASALPDVSDERTGISVALLELGKNADLYQFPISDAISLEHIAEDKTTVNNKGQEVSAIVSDLDPNDQSKETASLTLTAPKDDPANNVKTWMVKLPSGKYGTITREGNEVYINAIKVGDGQGGSLLYDLAHNFAINNGLEFIGDPRGVSDAAMRRRLENMLSGAIKYGTTDALKPHDDQYLGNESIGVPALDWKKGDTLANIRSMIDVSIASTQYLNPKASNALEFDTEDGRFTNDLGIGLDKKDIIELLGSDGRVDGSGQGGVTTLQRSAIFKSLLRSAQGRRAFLVQLREQQDRSSTNPSGKAKGIFYSRSAIASTLTSAANSARDVNLPAGYKVGDLFNSAPGKLNWWHKTVGTPYDLAQRSPAFKRVYDAVQTFINDVSYFATEAADLAPNILPKLESWKDIAKSPLSAADTKALSTPVFEGTLIWSRDESGKPVKMAVLEEAAAKLTPAQKAQRLLRGDHISQNVLKSWQGLPIGQYESLIEGKYESDMLKAGIVFTPAELKALFGLNDKQVGLYQEFRKSIDKSLTNLAIADMLRFGGKDVEPIREQVLESKTVGEAAEMLRDYLLSVADDNGVLVDTANKMIDKGDKAQDLMDRGYAPLSRFGTYTLDVVDSNGERAYFGMFESAADASKMRRKMEGLYPGSKITQGTVSEEAYKMFAGVSPETLELFGDMLGLESQGDSAASQAFQEYLKLAKSSRSAMKRLIQRKGIAGFNEDAGRVLAGFVYSNARQTASSLHMGEMTNAANEIDKTQGELKDAAVKLVDYIKNPREEAQALRGLLFAQYIGGSVASAMVNMTQPLTMTFPWLSQYGGVASAAKQMTAAMKDQGKKFTGDAKLDAALHRAEEDGTVSPQEVHQLMQQAQGKGALQSGDGTRAGYALAMANNALSKGSLAWGKLFGIAEQFNRRVTFIAAYRTAVAQGMANPDEFARKAIAETQGVYNKGNKPAWARGAVGATLFTFKQYSIAYVEMLSRMARNGPEGKKAALLALGVLFLMAGAGGMPGADDLDDVISGAMQSMGYNFDSKMKRKEFFASILGAGGAQFMERGISGLPGVPIDVSGRMGLGNLFPGTGLLTKKADHTHDVAEIAGPAGDFVKRGFDAAGKLLTGDIGGANGVVATIAPKAAQNLFQAFDMANRGMYRDAKGMKVLDTDMGDAVVKAIGFQPNDVKRVQDANFEQTRMIGLNKINETEIANRWAMGIFEKDASKVQEARDDLAEWNRDNPESPIRIDFQQIRSRVQKMNETKAQRITKTAPREIRNAVRQELARAQ